MKKYREKEGIKFQFTPLREGRPSRRTRQECRLCDFNSRPSARGDSKKCDLALDIYISIHAPPRGATIAFLLSSRNPRISIHAPPRGATTCSPRIRWKQSNFNSRPSARGDECLTSSCPSPMISIHAPPRGATLPDGASTTSFVAFQFTPLREGRQSSIINGLQGDYFNSRPSARGDASRQCRASGSTTYFNSRPSARGDCSRSARRVRPFYFNSRPSARGDGKGVAAIVLPNYFNSRPSARGDNRAERRKAARDIFQFTPLREGRLTMTTKPRNRVLFQFTPLREGRQNRAVRRSMRVVFQFTPLREGRRFHAHSKNTSLAFQFTPLREGRRLRNQRLTVPPRISIHAPPRGATAR